MTEDVDAGFVTIRQAAEALGLSERSIRRHVRHLTGTVPAAVRQESGRSPARVRLDALAARIDDTRTQATVPAGVRHLTGTVPASESAAITNEVAELRARVEGLQTQVEQYQHTQQILERQITERTVAESELRRLLLKSMMALPPAPDPVTTPVEVVSAPPVDAGLIETTTDTQQDAQPTRRPWWPWRRRDKA